MMEDCICPPGGFDHLPTCKYGKPLFCCNGSLSMTGEKRHRHTCVFA